MIVKNNGPAPTRRTSVEDIDRNNDTTSETSKDPKASETEIPPNENLRKFPDEAYGDTEIPGRNKDI
jgi:hypothetical protein